MRTLLKTLLIGTLALGVLAVNANADVAKGQKLYSKKLKKGCGLTGAKMAAKHTQEEWSSIRENGKMVQEIKIICPDVKKVKDKYIPHLYDFFFEYASDSGNVPSC